MENRSDAQGDRGGSRDGHEHQEGFKGPRGDGGGPDTRFLQLEMSQVLYTEAEEIARPALRELLLEAAKDRLRERFGDKITQLAQLAVDDLLRGVEASLEVEARIREHQGEPRDPSERLREVFATRPGGAASQARGGRNRGGRADRRRKRRSP